MLASKVLLAGRESLALLQVGEELLDVGVEIGDGALGGDEAVDAHAVVETAPQLPVAAADVGVADLAADGLDIAVPAKPDHELVVTVGVVTVRVGAGEEVVGDVGADVPVVVVPLHHAGHGVYAGDGAAPLDGSARVGVALDVVLAARPLPRAAPADVVRRAAVDVGALRSAARVLAPHVVVDVVAVARPVAVLVAQRLDLPALEDRGGFSGRGWCHRRRRGERDEEEERCGGLHLEALRLRYFGGKKNVCRCRLGRGKHKEAIVIDDQRQNGCLYIGRQGEPHTRRFPFLVQNLKDLPPFRNRSMILPQGKGAPKKRPDDAAMMGLVITGPRELLH